MCLITMLCWGSWANTQKLASKEWRFQLFYWDYAIGVFLLALILAFTMGSTGAGGRGFLADLNQADNQWLASAFLGGVIWNIGRSFSIIASTKAGAALSYGLGQGATMIGAFWGVFIWKEFKGAPKGTNGLLAAMFPFYFIGLAVLIASKL